ncbi:hypothetical protein TYRP_013020, partial [Tyrophagus putrescentiae]
EGHFLKRALFIVAVVVVFGSRVALLVISQSQSQSKWQSQHTARYTFEWSTKRKGSQIDFGYACASLRLFFHPIRSGPSCPSLCASSYRRQTAFPRCLIDTVSS